MVENSVDEVIYGNLKLFDMWVCCTIEYNNSKFKNKK